MNIKNASLLVMAQMFGINPMTRRCIQRDELEGVNISEEMELIKQKKSNLSARLRRVVEYRYKSA